MSAEPAVTPTKLDQPAAVTATLPGAVKKAPWTASDARFLDREESWLQFNERVLELAEDPTVPLLERVRFLAIFSSNLDEFFMVRVAGLHRRLATGLAVQSPAGRAPREELARINAATRTLMQRQANTFRNEIHPALARQGIEVLRWEELVPTEKQHLHESFRTRIYPVLTPLAVDPAHPFPYISGLSLNLAVVARDPETDTRVFARVKVPPLLPRFAEASAERYVPLEDVIAAHLDQLFKGMEVTEHHAFRVTRNEDLEVDEDITEDLLQALERELLRRRFGPSVRLEVEDSISAEVLSLLVSELGIDDSEIVKLPGPLDLAGLYAISDLDRPDLKYPGFVPAEVPPRIEGDIFALLRRGDVLVHHPYDSFTTSVQRLLEEAAADPDVLAIKQTLYRTSGDSPIVDALIDAAQAGKQVVVVVEIKARFDEQANIGWARKLEQAGCHVVYGFVGLKTHCKLALVVREEASGLRRYCHLGTGNYNPKTARLYEDIGLLTADEDVGADLTDLFNHLTGYSRQSSYRRLLVAPHSLRSGLVERIEREMAHAEAGRESGIKIKVNSLVDEVVIDALYRASLAGTPVDLCVRGICALRPGVPDLSPTITVRSILGRFLEHSRVFVFANGGAPEVWIGSADLMHRNLDRRVETLVQVTDRGHVADLVKLMDMATSDEAPAWQLDGDGEWTRVVRGPDGSSLADLQRRLLSMRRWRAVDG
jgi:polyphosphate kinase